MLRLNLLKSSRNDNFTQIYLVCNAIDHKLYSASRAKGTTFVTEYLFLSAGYYMDLRHPLDLPTLSVTETPPTPSTIFASATKDYFTNFHGSEILGFQLQHRDGVNLYSAQ